MEQPTITEEEMIRLAFDNINTDDIILPESRLDYTIFRISSPDPFAAVKSGKVKYIFISLIDIGIEIIPNSSPLPTEVTSY